MDGVDAAVDHQSVKNQIDLSQLRAKGQDRLFTKTILLFS